MQITTQTIEYLRDIITGDTKKTEYLSGPRLVEFFNQFGNKDAYGPGFPSRWQYCEDKLLELNRQNKIGRVIEHYYKPLNFVGRRELYSQLREELNDYLMYDDMKLVVYGKEVKLESIENSTVPHEITANKATINETSFQDDTISIILQKEVFSHVKSLLLSGHYSNAIEESYKIVREKLKRITGKEKASEGFRKENFSIIFGHEAKNEAEKDFFEGVKFLHLAIQNLRNEKSHTPAETMDKNIALHYIVLASLAYDLIN